jgi:WYL_2, Sm-like SH3 beta-barrel fold
MGILPYLVECNEKELSKFRTWLIGVLKLNDPVVIKFEKKDGTLREMKCSLNENIVVPYEKKTDKVKEKNDETLAVWDVEKNAWRSFQLRSIKEIGFDL